MEIAENSENFLQKLFDEKKISQKKFKKLKKIKKIKIEILLNFFPETQIIFLFEFLPIEKIQNLLKKEIFVPRKNEKKKKRRNRPICPEKEFLDAGEICFLQTYFSRSQIKFLCENLEISEIKNFCREMEKMIAQKNDREIENGKINNFIFRAAKKFLTENFRKQNFSKFSFF